MPRWPTGPTSEALMTNRQMQPVSDDDDGDDDDDDDDDDDVVSIAITTTYECAELIALSNVFLVFVLIVRGIFPQTRMKLLRIDD